MTLFEKFGRRRAEQQDATGEGERVGKVVEGAKKSFSSYLT